MFKQAYPIISAGQTQQLELTWSLGWKRFSIRLDGQAVGEISGGLKALRAGPEFRLPDGSVLRVQAVQTAAGAELLVLHNGDPLPGSGSPQPQNQQLPPGLKARQYALLFLFAGLLPGAFLLWLGLATENAARSLPDSTRVLLALGILALYAGGITLAVRRAGRPQPPEE